MRSGTPTRVDVGGKKPSKRKRTRYITGDTSRLSRCTCTSVRPRTCKGVAKGFVALASQTLSFFLSLSLFSSFFFRCPREFSLSLSLTLAFSLPLSLSLSLFLSLSRCHTNKEKEKNVLLVVKLGVEVHRAQRVTHHRLSYTSFLFPR